MGRLAGKVAIITGAARGMGESHARTFAREGARLILTDLNVEKGQALVILEAMKMEHTIRAPSAGLVRSLHYPVGAMVEAGSSTRRCVPPLICRKSYISKKAA